MEKERIIEILSRWNFWNKDLDIGILRKEYLDKIIDFIKAWKVVSLVGVRRSGKSTLMKQIAKNLIEQGIDRESILIINFEEVEFENVEAIFLQKIYEAYLEIIKPKEKPFLFLDEIQNVKGWERFVRSLNERKEAFIIISGSSSKLLSSEISTVLTGRQVYFEVYPLSFSEYLNFRGKKFSDKKTILLNATQIKKDLRDYIEEGGFPEIVLNENPEFKKKVCRSYYDDILNKDIINRFHIKRVEQLRILARFYLTNISSLINFHKLENFVKLPTETIRRFSSYLEAANLIFFVKRFSYSVKEQENSARKVCSIDSGLSNTVGFRFSENIGKLLENIVAIELKRRQDRNQLLEFYYWKNNLGKEIDFVLKEDISQMKLLHVCYDVEEIQTKNREIGGLLSAMKEFGLETGDIITSDYEEEEIIKQKRIKFIPLWKWLLTHNC